MTPFDELQTLRNEVAQLRRENGDLGEKLGVAIQHRHELLGVVKALVDAGGIMEPSEWFSKAVAALAKTEVKP
jgi:hypothetical protein